MDKRTGRTTARGEIRPQSVAKLCHGDDPGLDIAEALSPATRLSRREFLRAGVIGSGMLLLSPRAGAAGTATTQESSEGDIDAHVHVWTPDTQRFPLQSGWTKDRMHPPSFTAEQLLMHTRPLGVTRVVLIQMSYYGFDNSYMLDIMRRYKGMFSGVAIIGENSNSRAKMLELAKQGVRGFRIYLAGKGASTRYLDGEAMAAMWQCGADEGLAICALTNAQELPAIDRMCERFADTPVVIDHFARIGVDEILEKDVKQLCSLARHKNISVKASAFSSLSKKKAPYLDMGPMIRRVVDAYGPQRVMWGTDCPYQVQKDHTYRDSIDLIREQLDFLSASDKQWILRKTAERVFFT